MKVLFFTYDFPYPTTSGGKVRAYNLLKYAGSNVEISLFSFIRPGFHTDSLTELKKLGIEHIEIFPRRKVRDIRNIAALLPTDSVFKVLYFDKKIADKLSDFVAEKKIEIIHFESFYTAFYLDRKYHRNGVQQIYGSENKEHALYEDYVTYNAPALLRPGFRLQAQKIKREEEMIVRGADATLAVTESEKTYFQSLTNRQVHVIENGVSLSEFAFKKRTHRSDKTILFVGNFDYFPNVHAVEFFYDNVFRRLTAGNVRFSIIGKKAGLLPCANDPRVTTTDFIPDIRDAYYSADIFISPIQIGGGTNFKILEAMATGLPVVSFSDRVKDIGAQHERDVLTADTADSFYYEIVRLLDNPTLGETLATNARQIIEKKYSWDIIGKHLYSVWKELYEKP